MKTNSSNGNPIFSFIYIVAFIVIIVYIASTVDKQEKKRRKEIEDYCLKKGIEYHQTDGYVPTIIDKSKFVFGDTIKRVVEMSGKAEDFTYYIFDQWSITPQSKTASISKSTFCVIIDEKLHLPEFSITDKDKIFNAISKVLGAKEITFQDYSEFTNKFVLEGKDDNSVRCFFSKKLRTTFVHKHQNGLKYWGMDNCFVIIKDGTHNIADRLRMLSLATYFIKELSNKKSDEYLS